MSPVFMVASACQTLSVTLLLAVVGPGLVSEPGLGLVGVAGGAAWATCPEAKIKATNGNITPYWQEDFIKNTSHCNWSDVPQHLPTRLTVSQPFS